MTDATNPNPDDTTADAPEAGEDTALAAAAKTAEGADQPDPDKEADKVGEADRPAEGAPEAYDTAAFKMPEGVEFDTEGFTAVEPVLRDLNLSQDQAGKLIGIYAEKVVPLIQDRTLKAIDDKGAELRADLARKLQDDPEVGGKHLEESRSFAAKAIAHFIPDAKERAELSEFLNESGLGNQRHLLRIIAGAGKAISEATTASGQGGGLPLTEAEKFYGSQGKG